MVITTVVTIRGNGNRSRKKYWTNGCVWSSDCLRVKTVESGLVNE